MNTSSGLDGGNIVVGTNDFGFTTVGDNDVSHKSNVDDLMDQVLKLQGKVYRMREMIMPLLENLLVDDGKVYIYWPNRNEKISSFIKKLNKVVEE